MKIQDANRIAHTSSFAVSCTLNALLVLLLFFFGNVKKHPPPGGVVFKSVTAAKPEEVDNPPPILMPDPLPPIEDGIILNAPGPFPVSEDPQTVPVDDSVPLVNLLTETSIIRIALQPELGSRGDIGKKERIKEYAGETGGISEPAVIRALDWLQAHQHENGSWTKNGDRQGGGSNAGYTGLAILTFLAHGETPVSEKYGSCVAKGIRYLVENQDARGVFQPAGSHTAYGHAIATYAVAEAAMMTGNPLLNDPLRRAVAVMIEGQMSNGGYDYEYKQENRNDLSLGAWHVQAFKAVSLTLPEDQKIQNAMQSAMDGMLLGSKLIKDQGRGFTYAVTDNEVGAPRRILSAAGSLALQLTGRSRSSEAKESLRYLKEITPSDAGWFAAGAEAVSEHGGEIMFCYYAIQAYFYEDAHGKNFNRFLPVMVRFLATQQSADGSWAGFTEKGKHQGRLFNTTLAAMGLMVPYRSQFSTTVKPEPSPVSGEDDVCFEI
jgi:hypothetical protein